MAKPDLRIEYISWAGQVRDARHRWCAVLTATGEAWDYGSRDYLIREAEKHNLSYEVVAVGRDDQRSKKVGR